MANPTYQRGIERTDSVCNGFGVDGSCIFWEMGRSKLDGGEGFGFAHFKLATGTVRFSNELSCAMGVGIRHFFWVVRLS
jgi:hypothetical protein